MALLFKFLLSVLSTVTILTPCRSHSDLTYVSRLVKVELKEVFRDAWKLNDITQLHYAIGSYIILKEKLPVPEQDVCNFIESTLAGTDSLESLFHVTSIMKAVPACKSRQLLSDAGKKILAVRDKDNLGVEELFFLASSLKSISSSVSDTSFIAKSLKSALKSNETVVNLAHAFHIGSILEKREMETLHDKIDSVIAQADEIDAKYHQFEGGLTLTAFVVEGIYKLSESLNKAPSLKNPQLVKFFDYFLSRLSVSRPRGVFALLQVLSVLADNSFHTYVTIGMADDYLISKATPTVNVRVSNVFGEPVFKDSTPLTVKLVSCQRTDGGALDIKRALTPSADKVTYVASITDLNFTPDQYTVTVSITSPNENSGKKTIVNANQHNIKFKVTYRANIENLQVGVLDSEQSSTASLNKLEYPNKLREEQSIDYQQRLLLKFSLKDLDFGKNRKVQQAFVKLIDKTSPKEATFVCLSDSNYNYKLSIDHSTAKNALDVVSGEYELILVVGDVLLTESLKWTLAMVKFKRGAEQAAGKMVVEEYYKPKPEVQHLFKEPERRPPAVVSNVFTGFVLAPLFVLLILWTKLGINLKKFPFTLSAIFFHFGLGGIFVLFGVFWLKLNMFQTIKYLLLLGFVTFLGGNKLLRLVASNRKNL